MTYKQEIEKLKNRISNYQKRLQTEKQKRDEAIEQTKVETQIKMERYTIPKSSFGKFILDLVLTVEKYR